MSILRNGVFCLITLHCTAAAAANGGHHKMDILRNGVFCLITDHTDHTAYLTAALEATIKWTFYGMEFSV